MILTPAEAVVGIAMNEVSRRFEWQADRFACELHDKLKDEGMKDMGDRLGRALIQLHVKNLSTVWVDWLYVTFYIYYTCFLTDICIGHKGIPHTITLTQL